MRMPRGISRFIAVAAFGAASLAGINTQAAAADAAQPAVTVDYSISGADARTKEELGGAQRTKEERLSPARTKEE